VTGKLTPLGWSLLIIVILFLTIVLQCFHLNSIQSDAYHWRSVAAARDTLVQDAQGRAHRAAVDLAGVREMYAAIERVSEEQAAEIKRLRAHVQSVTTVTVQAPAETLYVHSEGTPTYPDSIQSYAFGIRSFLFDFEGATVRVGYKQDAYSLLNATITYKPVSLLLTVSRMKDDSYRTDVETIPPIWTVQVLDTVVLVERPSALTRIWRRIRFPLVFCSGVYVGARLFR